jgi:hypothetical protein
VEDQQSGQHTKFTNISGNNLKLILKWSGFTTCIFKTSKNLTFAGHITDDSAYEPSLTCLDLGTREKAWRGNIMGCSFFGFLIWVIIFMFSFSLEALLNGFFDQRKRFSSHC